MSTYTQKNRLFALSTPLGADALLLAKFTGREAISELFEFHLDLFAPALISFNDLLLQSATLRLSVPGSPTRFIQGIIREIEEIGYQPGPSGPKTFLRYQAILAPRLWRLSLCKRSRVWQRKSVPQILSQVLHTEWGLDVTTKFRTSYQPRDYCVQYQESDLNFVLRLMEDEGIWFTFLDTESSQTLLLADAPGAHPALSPGELSFDPVEGGTRPQGRILNWRSRRVPTSTKIHIRDHNFEKPGSLLDAIEAIQPSVALGSTTNHFKANDESTAYEYPGGFARRFDRIQPDGQDQPDEVENLFKENQRVAHLRMQAETVKTLSVRGESDCGHLAPASPFTLSWHYNGDGAYILTRVDHVGDQEAGWLLGQTPDAYSNKFEAIPRTLPFRPQRVTPRPTILGTQTARVCGPDDSQTFLDRYGRVKVKFAWDTGAGRGIDHSCWVRVAQIWAGKRWGAFFWPRVGNEVVVTFENGDPERPLIVGSVYNDVSMPPFELPANAAKAGIKSTSMSGSFSQPLDPMTHFNGIVFHDVPGEEHVEVHSERNSYQTSEHSHFHNVNGVHRVNVSDRQSVHVGCIPTSGSGSGEADTPSFLYATTTDPTKRIGVNLASVVGLNQTNTLGVFSSLTVGDCINVVNNPIGLAADGWAFGPTSGPMQAITGSIGSAFGGTTNLTYGSTTSVSYGSQISVSRMGRASISQTTNYRDPGVGGAAGTATVLVLALAELISALNVAGLVVADLESYSSDDKVWQGILGASLAAMALNVETEVVIALIDQAAIATQAAEAATNSNSAGIAAMASAQIANSLTSILTPEQSGANKLHYTSGYQSDYCQGRISGVQDSHLIFAGATATEQTVIGMNSTSLALTAGGLSGSSLELTSLTIGLGFVGSYLQITPTSITLRCGETQITLSPETGIVLSAGDNSITINPAEGINATTTGGNLALTPEAAALMGPAVTVDAAGDLDLTATALNEEVGEVSRGAGLATIE
jgi:type VI secretion system secreted protein VgrG